LGTLAEHPTVYCLSEKLKYTTSIPEAEMKTRLNTFLLNLLENLQQQGCQLIGHIKGVLEVSAEYKLFFSVTSFNQPPHYKGRLPEELSSARMVLNVIVYGADKIIIGEAVSDLFQKHLI
jgi:hypothetical protein